MTEVVADSVQFLEPRRDGQQNNQQYNAPPPQQSSNQQQTSNYQSNEDTFNTGGGPIEVSDDDLPF